ncbi:CENP-B protein, partial [Choiromyces venosus 120613-1]
ITTFHSVNADGSEKERLTVIAQAQNTHAFCCHKINSYNLSVTYRYNKKAWMLSELWYEYLQNLNDKMQIQGRKIILITDNCPSHPHPNSPPDNYEGPILPILTHLNLLYLPPNSTSKLQPLDQGIIASFKAAYHHQYADYMVQYFNHHGISVPKLDILASIYIMPDACESIPLLTISNCWKKSGLL